MTRFIVVTLCCVAFGSVAVMRAGQLPNTREQGRGQQQQIAEPLELTGKPKPLPPLPTPALRQFLDSKTIQAADPKDSKTLAPAIEELTSLIRLEPRNSDFYFLRASLSCYARANSKDLLDDINKSMSISLQDSSKPTAYTTLKDRYALKAKVEFDSGRFVDAMHDLDAAIEEDYDTAEQVFNDGETKPSTTTKQCVWTQADLDKLAQQFAADFRPPLYLGLYLSYFLSFNLESDYKPVLDAFQRAGAVNPKSPLPHLFIGKLYTLGRLGGLMSVGRAKCLDFVLPRTPACLALDETGDVPIAVEN